MVRRAAMATLVVAAVGCAGDDAPDAPDAPDVGDFLDRVICVNVVACGFHPSIESCLAAHADRTLQETTLVADVADGIIGYDADQASACIASFEDKACDGGIDISGWLATQPPCSEVFVGTVVEGDACTIHEECVGAMYCARNPGCLTTCCPGTCAPGPVYTPVGESCGSSTLCVNGAWCDPSMTCVPQITQPGLACSASSACASPLYCAHDPATAMYTTCEERSDAGDPCGGGLECNGPHLFCDEPTSTCAKKGAPGDTCDADRPCLYEATCSEGTCVLLQDIGGACASDADCLEWLLCGASGTCELLPDDMPCE